MRHTARSYGRALIYNHQHHEAGHRWVHVYWKYKIKTYTTNIWHHIGIITPNQSNLNGGVAFYALTNIVLHFNYYIAIVL